VRGQDADEWRSICIIPCVSGQIPLPEFILRQHDLGAADAGGYQISVKIGNKIVNLRGSPQAGFVATGSGRLDVRLVLHRDGVEGYTIGVFHGGHIAGQLAGVGGIIGGGVNIVTAIDVAIVLEIGGRASSVLPGNSPVSIS